MPEFIICDSAGSAMFKAQIDDSDDMPMSKKLGLAVKLATLRGADLWDANLKGANLRGVNLAGANLRGADLRAADLAGATLRHANLAGANLRHANLRGATLAGANLRGATLRHASLAGANLRGADLWGVNLRGVSLRGADLRAADLRGAALRGADLWGANLRGADLWGANLAGANSIIDGGQDKRGYHFIAQERDDADMNITAGCRYFESLAAAREHWELAHEGDLALRAECLAKVDHFEAVSKARGWKTTEKEDV